MIFKEKYLKPCGKIKYKILKKMYLGNKITKYIVEMYIKKFEGGHFYSSTIRRIYREEYDINVGIGSYGCFNVNFRPHIEIGSYCSIAPGVHRLVGDHPISDVSTHPVFHLERFGFCTKDRYVYHKLVIGNDVWIGTNAIITGKCEVIGDGAVIGAGAVVTHNVEPYAVVVGCPAKTVHYRFDKEKSKLLIESKWYELNPLELEEAVKYADDIDMFCEKVKKLRLN